MLRAPASDFGAWTCALFFVSAALAAATSSGQVAASETLAIPAARNATVMTAAKNLFMLSLTLFGLYGCFDTDVVTTSEWSDSERLRCVPPPSLSVRFEPVLIIFVTAY
jgi:hypothetical protein